MKTLRSRGEHNAPVEHGRNRLHGLLHFRVPQLKRAATGFVPILVEIDQEIEPTFKPQLGMQVEISMNA